MEHMFGVQFKVTVGWSFQFCMEGAWQQPLHPKNMWKAKQFEKPTLLGYVRKVRTQENGCPRDWGGWQADTWTQITIYWSRDSCVDPAVETRAGQDNRSCGGGSAGELETPGGPSRSGHCHLVTFISGAQTRSYSKYWKVPLGSSRGRKAPPGNKHQCSVLNCCPLGNYISGAQVGSCSSGSGRSRSYTLDNPPIQWTAL